MSFRLRMGWLGCLGMSLAVLVSQPQPPEQPQRPSAPQSPQEPAVDRVSPHFTWSRAEWQILLPTLDHPQVVARELAFLDGVDQLLRCERQLPGLLQLVDRTHPLAPDYLPPGLVLLDSYPSIQVNKEGMLLRAEVVAALLPLLAESAGLGLQLPVLSAYRSYAYQREVYRGWQRRSSSASRFSAAPGHSQHQLGTVVDLGRLDVVFATTPAGKWLATHAARFGFSLSYPEGQEEETGYDYEPWHYRYLGKAALQLQQQFFADSQQRLLQFWQRYRGLFAQRWRG